MGKKISFEGAGADSGPRKPRLPRVVVAKASAAAPVDAAIAEHFTQADPPVDAITVTEYGPPPPPEDPRLGPGFYRDIEHEVYHRDPGVRPSLSASMATVITTESPLEAWWFHPRFGAAPQRRGTAATERGTVIHKLLLGRGQDIVTFGYDDWRTKVARQDKARTLAEGKLPILKHVMAEYETVASIYQKRIAQLDPSTELFLGGEETEVVAIWEERGVLCRCLIDNLRSSDLVIDDIKTMPSVRPDYVEKHLWDYGSDIQAAANVSALEHLIPEAQGRVRFRFVCMQAEPPYDVVIYQPDETFMELGRRRWARGIDRWAPCLEADLAMTAEERKADPTRFWPGHSRHVVRVSVAAWMLARDLDREMSSLDTRPDHPF